jgi:glutaredoxin
MPGAMTVVPSKPLVALWLSACVVLLAPACQKAHEAQAADAPEGTTASGDGPATPGPVKVTPPFAVRGDLDGLLMVWFDAEGLHTAQKRSEIPEARRAQVRIDSLNVAPDERLDPELLYVADLRSPGSDGTYPVQKASRSWFDAQVDREKPKPVVDESSVVVYKASWCGACKSAEAYLRSRHVPFVEKDVEKDPGASQEMQRKAQAKGLTPRGVPVIDFHGEIMLGFDQQRISALIDRYAKPI